MSYLEEFIEAIKYRNELFSNEKKLDVEAYSKYESITEDDLKDFRDICLHFLENTLYKRRINPISKCHSICELFKKYINMYANKYNNKIFVTIGDVSFKGELLYNPNKEILKQILDKGVTIEDLDVHVWITYKSIYIFDPTIKYNLSYKRNLIEPPNPHILEESLFLWNDNNKQEFDYYPLLVDNEFFSRVDEI